MTPPKNRCELDIVLDLLVKEFTKAQIRKKLNIKSSTLANRLRRLEDMGYITRKGKYIINVLKTSIPSSHKHPRVTKNQVHIKLNKRGHAHNFKVIFPNEEDLRKKPKVINEFRLKKIEKLSFGSYKLKKDKNSIWINKESLTIYSRNSYYSKNALHSKFRALKEVDILIYNLRGRFDFKGIYGIEIFREHYGLIFNKFAKWLLKEGKKMYVRNNGNKAILWVDNSRKDDINLEEFEGKDPLKINKADEYFDSHERTNFNVTPERVLKKFKDTDKKVSSHDKVIDKAIGTLGKYDKEIALHLKVEKRKLELTEKQTRQIEDQNQIFREIRDYLKNVNK